MHVLQCEGAAIGAAHDGENVVQGGDFEPKHVVDENRAIHVSVGEPVGGGVKLWMWFGFAHSQRVEVGNQVSPDPVGADDHERAQAVEHGLADLGLVECDTFFGGFCFDLIASGGGLCWPLPVEGCSEVVVWHWWPIVAAP